MAPTAAACRGAGGAGQRGPGPGGPRDLLLRRRLRLPGPRPHPRPRPRHARTLSRPLSSRPARAIAPAPRERLAPRARGQPARRCPCLPGARAPGALRLGPADSALGPGPANCARGAVRDRLGASGPSVEAASRAVVAPGPQPCPQPSPQSVQQLARGTAPARCVSASWGVGGVACAEALASPMRALPSPTPPTHPTPP
jgi:hypothetical protein